MLFGRRCSFCQVPASAAAQLFTLPLPLLPPELVEPLLLDPPGTVVGPPELVELLLPPLVLPFELLLLEPLGNEVLLVAVPELPLEEVPAVLLLLYVFAAVGETQIRDTHA